MTQPDSSPLVESLTSFKERRRIPWLELANNIGVDERLLRAYVREHRDATLPTLKRMAAYFGWTAVDVGIVAMYVPRGVREKEGKKREQKKAATLDEPTDDPHEP